MVWKSQQAGQSNGQAIGTTPEQAAAIQANSDARHQQNSDSHLAQGTPQEVAAQNLREHLDNQGIHHSREQVQAIAASLITSEGTPAGAGIVRMLAPDDSQQFSGNSAPQTVQLPVEGASLNSANLIEYIDANPQPNKPVGSLTIHRTLFANIDVQFDTDGNANTNGELLLQAYRNDEWTTLSRDAHAANETFKINTGAVFYAGEQMRLAFSHDGLTTIRFLFLSQTLPITLSASTNRATLSVVAFEQAVDWQALIDAVDEKTTDNALAIGELDSREEYVTAAEATARRDLEVSRNANNASGFVGGSEATHNGNTITLPAQQALFHGELVKYAGGSFDAPSEMAGKSTNGIGVCYLEAWPEQVALANGQEGDIAQPNGNLWRTKTAFRWAFSNSHSPLEFMSNRYLAHYPDNVRAVAQGMLAAPDNDNIAYAFTKCSNNISAHIENGGVADPYLYSNNAKLPQLSASGIVYCLPVATFTVEGGEVTGLIPQRRLLERNVTSTHDKNAKFAQIAQGGPYVGSEFPYRSVPLTMGEAQTHVRYNGAASYLNQRTINGIALGSGEDELGYFLSGSDVYKLAIWSNPFHARVEKLVLGKWVNGDFTTELDGSNPVTWMPDFRAYSRWITFGGHSTVTVGTIGGRAPQQTLHAVFAALNWQQAAKKDANGDIEPIATAPKTYSQGEVVDETGDGTGRIWRIETAGDYFNLNIDAAVVSGNATLLVRENIGQGARDAIVSGEVWVPVDVNTGDSLFPRDAERVNSASITYLRLRIPVSFNSAADITRLAVDGIEHTYQPNTALWDGDDYTLSSVSNIVGVDASVAASDRFISVKTYYKTAAFEPSAHPEIDGEVISKGRITNNYQVRYGARLLNELTGRVAAGTDKRILPEIYNHEFDNAKFSLASANRQKHPFVSLNATGQWGMEWLAVKDKAENYYIYWWQLLRSGSAWSESASGKPWVQYVGNWGDDVGNELAAGCSKVRNLSLNSFKALIEGA